MQPGEFYEKLTQIEKEHLAENLASDLNVISDDIRKIVLGYFDQVSTDLKTSIGTKMKEH
ncbi:hypothetical protein BACI71_70546 [Bacillus mycoides]|uniref:Catalase immune-responsive domain-containing protein n=1 Tax=Bacillus mycoides TaxID=1405 RepID=A0A654BLE0_BACMY|nr:hypothetical protein BACI71_70546 [Bacillus mycoides]